MAGITACQQTSHIKIHNVAYFRNLSERLTVNLIELLLSQQMQGMTWLIHLDICFSHLKIAAYSCDIDICVHLDTFQPHAYRSV